MKRRIFGLVILLAIALVIWRSVSGSKSVGQTATVERRDLEISFSASGKLRAVRQAELAFVLTGQLEKVASSSARFRKGEIVASLKADDLWAVLQQSYAKLNQARSTFYNQLEVKSETDKTYGWKEDGISRAKVNQADNLVAAAKDAEEAAAFAVDAARAAYQKSFLRAPFDGVVGESRWAVGEVVTAGQKVLTFLDPSSFYFEAEVDEVDVIGLHLGDPVKVNLDVFKDKEFNGTLTQIDESAHPTASGGTSYFVRVSLGKDPGSEDLRSGIFGDRLRSGFNGDAQLVKEKKLGSLVVPADFVFQRDNQNYVWKKTAKGLFEVKVELGEFVEGFYEVVSGLSEGEEIVEVSKR